MCSTFQAKCWYFIFNRRLVHLQSNRIIKFVGINVPNHLSEATDRQQLEHARCFTILYGTNVLRKRLTGWLFCGSSPISRSLELVRPIAALCSAALACGSSYNGEKLRSTATGVQHRLPRLTCASSINRWIHTNGYVGCSLNKLWFCESRGLYVLNSLAYTFTITMFKTLLLSTALVMSAPVEVDPMVDY